MTPTDDPRNGTNDSSWHSEPGFTNVRLLQYLIEATGESFDQTRTIQAVRQADHDVPPTATRAARTRLIQAANTLGIQLLSQALSIREALNTVEPESPLALFSVSHEGTGRWFMLAEQRAGQGRLVQLLPGDSGDFLSAERLAEQVGAEDADTVLEWLVAQPANLAGETGKDEGSVEPEAADESHGPPPAVRLFGLLRSERRELWMVVGYAVAIGVLSLAAPVALMAVVNTVALATLAQQLVVLCLGLFVCLGLSAVLRVLQCVVVEFMQRRVFARVAADLAYRLPRVRLEAYDRQHGPELVNRFFYVLTVQKASATLLLDGIDVVLQMVIGLALLASYHQVLLGFDLALLASLAFLVWPLGRGAVRSAIQESKAKYAVAGWLEEMARHPAAFKLSGAHQFALERADQLTRQYLLARDRQFRIVMRQSGFALALYALSTSVLLAIGAFLVIGGQLTLGQLVAAEMVVSLVVASFTKFGKHLESYYDLLAAVDKLGHLIDLPIERTAGVTHEQRSRGAAVKIHRLSFSYAVGGRRVLDEFSLEIAPGERVAIIGPNGAGKSTLVDLLFGLREPTSGFIEIDGMDLRDLRLESLREHVAVVRGIEVFEGSLVENIRMGRSELSIADIRHALQSVGLLGDILSLPDGLETRLGIGGSPLSLGQAERLMLARAIAGHPRLLVLDEQLDDMDRDARTEVYPAIVGDSAHWTLIVVTHSNEVAQLCDRAVQIRRPSRESPVSAEIPAQAAVQAKEN